MKVAQIVDSVEYVRQNCFQHQLVEALESMCDLKLISLRDLYKPHDFTQYDAVLSTLKLRTLVGSMSFLKERIGNTSMFIYEQDPWESFTDTATFKGAYQKIHETLNVASFLTTSQHWVNVIKEHDMPSKFVKMWPLPRYCNDSPTWSTRPVKFGFKGTLHPYRKRFFDELKPLGIDVHVFPSGNYQDFLKSMSETQFFLHSEDDCDWSIDGKKMLTNGSCWAKDIEVAARGCYVIRKWEPESAHYFIDKIPCILTYNDISEIPALIDATLSDPSSDLRSRDSVRFINEQNAWSDLFEALKDR